MKKKGTTLKDLTVQELQDKLQEERSALAKLRFDHAVSPVENPVLLRSRRREVARVLTELRARELNVKSN
ncbi:MAG: 50S ribosomal protein L29 [Flavobacteriales bacterium]|jgi:large subunit ribosomal protein L29|nr:50S ribosomal protein L29 [Flavobacteriales bacterium]MBK7943713.1 50S ribosomal protein L29 [Flavobacteriales bacterium]MBK8950477.1 50S ribosomal protein L29 [Flavobacteriales bacterium]MBK9699605.1 50S ribosomal protein L29 [Flavobacteriales bacterium]